MHSDDCETLSNINKKEEINLTGNYNNFLNKCFKYLDSMEIYNKKEFTFKL